MNAPSAARRVRVFEWFITWLVSWMDTERLGRIFQRNAEIFFAMQARNRESPEPACVTVSQFEKARVIPTGAQGSARASRALVGASPTSPNAPTKIPHATTQVCWLITVFPRGAENSTRGRVRSPRSVRCANSTPLGMTRVFQHSFLFKLLLRLRCALHNAVPMCYDSPSP